MIIGALFGAALSIPNKILLIIGFVVIIHLHFSQFNETFSRMFSVVVSVIIDLRFLRRTFSFMCGTGGLVPNFRSAVYSQQMKNCCTISHNLYTNNVTTSVTH